MWEIQGFVDGVWQADAVGRTENEFETEEEAAEMLPILAKQLDCDESQLRVREIQRAK